jgi:multiple sugar transport system substrate-binding protein
MLSRRRVMGVSGAVTATGLFGCMLPSMPSVSQPQQERPTIRVLARTSYDPSAWEVVAERDSQAQVRVAVEIGPEQTAPYGQKLLSLAAAEALPDVTYVHPNFFSTAAGMGLLRDIGKLAARTTFDLQGIQRELLDSVRWIDGVVYALPYSGAAWILIVNEGLFRGRGVILPMEHERAGQWDWETFRETLRQLTVRAPGQPPIVGMPEHLRGMQYQSQWVFMAGGEVWSKDLSACVLDQPPAVQALEYLATLHAHDRVTIQPDEAGEFGGNIQAGFTTGRVGVYFRATTELQQVREFAESGAQLGIAPVPRGPVRRAPRGAANSWAITQASKQPEAAWRAITAWHRDPLLEFLYKQKYLFPCREAQFDHPAFKAALFPWENLEVERQALRDMRIMATPARFTEIDQLWTRLWVQARDGRRTVRDILGEFVPQANAMLRDT